MWAEDVGFNFRVVGLGFRVKGLGSWAYIGFREFRV